MKSAIGAVTALLVVGCAARQDAAPAAATAATVDLSGIWVRIDEAGSGSFGETLQRIAKADLQPEAKAAAEAEAARRKAEDAKLLEANGGVYRTPARCNAPSIAFMMQHSGGIDIVQAEDEILVIPESPGAQHIYMDGRPHPAAGDWKPSAAGHSVGHWEGDTLVVSTVGMTAGGGLPGMGRKRPETELVERFRLRDPAHLVVSFTWNDPQLYVKPHQYEFTYEKQPDDSYAFESWCDVTDPAQGQSIVVPKQ